MKKSITRKIITSYLLLILLSFLFVGIFFNFAVRFFMESQAAKSLISDTKTIAGILEKSLNTGETSEARIREFRQKAAKSFGRVESKWIVASKDGRILLPKNIDESPEFKSQITQILSNRIGNIASKDSGKIGKENIFHFEADGSNEYMAVIAPVKAGVLGNQRNWLILYTEVGPVKELSRGLILVLFFSIIFTGIMAVAVGIIQARSIAKPIIALKDRAERLSKRDYDTKVQINSGDELEELAHTINKMAVELKEYDYAQKKFLQNASHELKTPLMSIQGYAEGIKDGVFDDNTKALDIIVDESKRLKNLVGELIFLSKLETMEDFYKFSTESLQEVIEKCVEKVNSIALKNNIHMKILNSGDTKINIDKDKFIQAIINILGNCLRYAKSEINVDVLNSEEYCTITISDDGEGFEPSEIEHIFTRFYKGKKGNTGLGLAITKVIIEKHGGTLEAGNKGGSGAEFRIRFESGSVLF